MTAEHKTNVCRILDRMKIKYETVDYAVDEKDLSAVHVASELGEDIHTVYKTLVLQGAKKGYFVCVVPGDAEVDLKKAASASGEKKVAMIPMKDLLTVTGYIRGGCSPIGMKKRYPVYLHSEAVDHDYIYVSAGIRGKQIKITPSDLINAVSAELCDLTSKEL